MEQHITYGTTSEVRIAYATAGTGPPVMFAPITARHLELDWQTRGVSDFSDRSRRNTG